jgi:hypothetical protein
VREIVVLALPPTVGAIGAGGGEIEAGGFGVADGDGGELAVVVALNLGFFAKGVSSSNFFMAASSESFSVF